MDTKSLKSLNCSSACGTTRRASGVTRRAFTRLPVHRPAWHRAFSLFQHSTQLNVAVLFRVGKTACFASFFSVHAYRQICLHKRGNRKLFQNLEMIHPSTPLIGLISRRSTMIHVCMCRLRLTVHFKVPCAADKQHCRPSINPCSPSTKLRQLIGFVTGNCMCLHSKPDPQPSLPILVQCSPPAACGLRQ
jgi:hypothetical protein